MSNFLFQNHRDISLLGEGNFGQVWKAQRFFTNDIVAVKYLKRFTSDDITSFGREVSSLTQCVDPNIVEILDHNLYGPRPYIVMEYCDGGTLAQWSGKLTHEYVTNLLCSMARALRVVHSKGGFHRDIKPLNILLKKIKGGTIAKLSDFGLARLPNPNSLMTQTPRGTIAYMAPEIKRGEKFTQAADIYSLGATCFELLTGTPERIFHASIPINLNSLLRSMTDENPSNRPSILEIECQTSAMIEARSSVAGDFVSTLSWAGLGLAAIALIGLVMITSDGES